MTTDQLERDLEALAEPRTTDSDLRYTIRSSLTSYLPSTPRRQPRTRPVIVSVALAGAALAAAVVAMVGIGNGTSANAAILAHLVHAMTAPANMIVHVRETGTLADGTQVSAEWWQETNAPSAFRLIKGPLSSQTEESADGTTSSRYDPTSNTVYRQTDTKAPTLIDPVESVRAALRNGTAQVAGTATIDGRSLYKVVLPTGVIGYFDRSNYQPAYVDNPQSDGSVVRTKLIAYEELAATPVNEQLLSIAAQHPGARVQTGEAPAPTKPAGSKK